MARKLVKYCLIDTFTETPFKGNPSAVCLRHDEKDDYWLQNVAREFNQAVTSYLTQLESHHPASDDGAAAVARFRLRWYTRDGEEISLCGHATLAASHFILAHILPDCEIFEFSTLFGSLTGRRVKNDAVSGSFSTEMNFPVLPLVEYDASKVSTVSKLLNGAPVVEIKQTASENYLLVVLPSGEDVKEVEPDIDSIRKYPTRGIIIFCPNLGADEDHVCGSSHCALALYWGRRLGKHDLVSYYASTRSGVINVHLDEINQRVLIRGHAVTVNIHCQGCEKKVHKVLKKINGVSTISIDGENNKVTVSGAIDPYALLKALSKTGNRAEILWDSSVSTNKHSSNQKHCTQSKVPQWQEKPTKNMKDYNSSNTKNVSYSRDFVPDGLHGPAAHHHFGGSQDGGHGQAISRNYYGGDGNVLPPPRGCDCGNPVLPLQANGYNYWAACGTPPPRPSVPPPPSPVYSRPSLFSDENPNGCWVM